MNHPLPDSTSDRAHTSLEPESAIDTPLQSSRRVFLAASGGGAASLAVASLLGSAEAASANVSPAATVGEGPFVAYVENVKSGKVTVFAGEGATTFTDKTIVSAIVWKAGK
ncbi:MAG: hypothetical protein ACRCYQ_11240 [Nocardioides sp.]